MTTPGFPPHTLDPEGTPVWITDLASDNPHHILHVVHGIEPEEALERLGARTRLMQIGRAHV